MIEPSFRRILADWPRVDELLDLRMKIPDFTPEPWMAEFVRGRHSKEEWKAFFEYCESGPFKRRLIRWGVVLWHALVGFRGRTR